MKQKSIDFESQDSTQKLQPQLMLRSSQLTFAGQGENSRINHQSLFNRAGTIVTESDRNPFVFGGSHKHAD